MDESIRIVSVLLGTAYFYSKREAVRYEGLLRGLGHNVTVETYDDATREWNTLNGTYWGN